VWGFFLFNGIIYYFAKILAATAAETTNLTGFTIADRKADGRAAEASERREEGPRRSGDGAASPR
jgi:hypothetical protein